MQTVVRVRIVLIVLVASLVGGVGLEGASSQTSAECLASGGDAQEPFGPTDITAVSGNQTLTAAVNADATVTVFRWPSAGYYDQIKYRTTDRSEPRKGALINEGALIGVAWRSAPGNDWDFSWLRRWSSRQRFADDDGDEIITRFSDPISGLDVTVRDVVDPHRAVLLRQVNVRRAKSSEARQIRIFAFANFNPVVSKTQKAPVDDWCTEERNDDGATYLEELDAVVSSLSGVDSSTGDESSVSVGIGFSDSSRGHEVGEDTYQSSVGGTSAYDDAADGMLSGSDQASGQADAALFVQKNLGRSRDAGTTILMAAAPTQGLLQSVLARARADTFRERAAAKARWWRAWLSTAALPRSAPRVVTDLAKRALISIRQATDRVTGAVATSVSTQSPLATDRPLHAAYINEALEAAGHPEAIEVHNFSLARWQATSVSKPPGGETTPPGNWAQSYYTDGVVASTVPYEIDATGYGIWTLWEHYRRHPNSPYLTGVYSAIQRAAHYLTDDPPVGCRDPATGLHCTAYEEDSESPQRTLTGAQGAWLGLKAAAAAARTRGTEDALVNAQRWDARRAELGAAIRDTYFDEACGCFTLDHETGGSLLWPVRFITGEEALGQAEQNLKHIKRAIAGKATTGSNEARAILGSAYVFEEENLRMKQLKDALVWIASELTTRSTGLLGEHWEFGPQGSEDPGFITKGSQPHNFNQAMFYLAALKVYGATQWSD
jgi:hypothetical protein